MSVFIIFADYINIRTFIYLTIKTNITFFGENLLALTQKTTFTILLNQSNRSFHKVILTDKITFGKDD